MMESETPNENIGPPEFYFCYVCKAQGEVNKSDDFRQ